MGGEMGLRWHLGLLAGAITLLAFALNRFAPAERPRLRRIVLLYIAYAALTALSVLFTFLQLVPLNQHTNAAARLFEVIAIVQVAVVALFSLFLPAVKVRPPQLVGDLTTGIAYVIAFVVVLAEAGMNITSVIATSAIVGTVFTVSMQSTFGNILGGVALQLDGSIQVGDWIQLENGRQGKVREIRWRHTMIETRDWDTIIVPNATLLSSSFTLLGRREGKIVPHRMWVYFHVDFRYAPTLVISAVEEALHSCPVEGVAEDPKPNCIVQDFGHPDRPSFALYAVRYWLKDLASDDPTSSRVRARIYTALKRAQIPLARPAHTLLLAQDDDEESRQRERQQRGIAILRRLELFRALTEAELEAIASKLIFAPFSPGEVITRRGAVAHWLYILARGSVDVSRPNAEGKAEVFASLEAPAYFGEMGLLTGEPRTADVSARGYVECFRLEKEALQQVLRERPHVAEELSRTLAVRQASQRPVANEQEKTKQVKEESDAILSRIVNFFGL